MMTTRDRSCHLGYLFPRSQSQPFSPFEWTYFLLRSVLDIFTINAALSFSPHAYTVLEHPVVTPEFLPPLLSPLWRVTVLEHSIMAETTPLNFMELMALEAFGKGADKYMSKRPAFNSSGNVGCPVEFRLLDYHFCPQSSSSILFRRNLETLSE